MPKELKGRDILAVTNDASIDINNQVLACLLGETVVYEALDDIVSDDPIDRLTFPVEFLNSLTQTDVVMLLLDCEGITCNYNIF
ncbi:hypothetical protein AVEN_89243-1 [Araneus ventricosus]|uniref:ATP-dependent DNA helicase n=1 Tax=Araneus ventricosus TaxID=182803 RepID=A0A4Y2L297_ARAVE|nr:hypothetical protein AVEN_89243-1 [Araneus ventricosus]